MRPPEARKPPCSERRQRRGRQEGSRVCSSVARKTPPAAVRTGGRSNARRRAGEACAHRGRRNSHRGLSGWAKRSAVVGARGRPKAAWGANREPTTSARRWVCELRLGRSSAEEREKPSRAVRGGVVDASLHVARARALGTGTDTWLADLRPFESTRIPPCAPLARVAVARLWQCWPM